MLIRAHRLSSPDVFANECNNLRSIFLKLKYPPRLIESTVGNFIRTRDHARPPEEAQQDKPIRIVLPFKDQKSADALRRNLNDLNKKIESDLQPVFTSRKIMDEIKVVEAKPPLINQHCVAYKFSCNLCDSDNVGFTSRHLFQRIAEYKYSANGQHLKEYHKLQGYSVQDQFTVLKKCRTKLDCLRYEMLFIRNIKPKLNTQSDSVRAKLFIEKFDYANRFSHPKYFHSFSDHFIKLQLGVIKMSFNFFLSLIFLLKCLRFSSLKLISKCKT